MNFLYHIVPRNLTGTTLYPLNQLKGKHRQLFKEQVRKYAGREAVRGVRIPALGNCRWNDVLFLTAVHPSELRRALTETGVRSPRLRFFEIDPRTLNPARAVVMCYRRSDAPGEFKYEPFNPARLGAYSKLPRETREYYLREREAGRRPLLFHCVPHILYKGTLDVSLLRIIEV